MTKTRAGNVCAILLLSFKSLQGSYIHIIWDLLYYIIFNYKHNLLNQIHNSLNQIHNSLNQMHNSLNQMHNIPQLHAAC